MTSKEKYIAAFCKTFDIAAEEATTLRYKGIPAWDSIGHMALMAEIEEAFGIMLETNDVMKFTSFEEGTKLLEKYSVAI